MPYCFPITLYRTESQSPEIGVAEKPAQTSALPFTPTGSIDDIFAGRMTMAQERLDTITYQIAERARLRDWNLKSIENDIIKINERISGLRVIAPHLDELIKAKSGLYSDIIGLEREERQERVSYLRDTALLKKDLMDAIEAYAGLKSQSMLMGDPNGN